MSLCPGCCEDEHYCVCDKQETLRMGEKDFVQGVGFIPACPKCGWQITACGCGSSMHETNEEDSIVRSSKYFVPNLDEMIKPLKRPTIHNDEMPICSGCLYPEPICRCETAENPKEYAGRKKTPLQLNPPAALREMAKAHASGADKYGAWNWRDTNVHPMTYVGAILRHLYAYMDKEDIDPESGVHHLGHIMACCGVILDATSVGKVNDDRP